MSELSQHAKLIKAIEIAKGAQVGIELSYFDVLEVAGELNEAKEVVAMLNARIAELEAEVTKCHELQDSYCDRIAELEADSVQIQYICEDELPEGISDEVFSAMYACSTVDFVRVYPYITIDGRKRFLIELPEVQE